MILQSLQDKLPDTAYRIFKYAKKQRIFLIEGPMGSGKTTLIKALCSALGVIDRVTSPTFALINEYHTIHSEHIYHFDCYRINEIQDAIELDFEAYFASKCYCFIEWPFRIEAILPLNYLLITIEMVTSTIRNLNCCQHNSI